MLFLQQGSYSNHFSVYRQKPLFFCLHPPTPVEIGLFFTGVGRSGQKKSGFCQFTEKWLGLELSCTNNIFDPLGKLFKSKRRRFWLQNWLIYELISFKFEMVVAGPILEPQSCNFEKLDIFKRCSNDFSTVF